MVDFNDRLLIMGIVLFLVGVILLAWGAYWAWRREDDRRAAQKKLDDSDPWSEFMAALDERENEFFAKWDADVAQNNERLKRLKDGE